MLLIRNCSFKQVISVSTGLNTVLLAIALFSLQTSFSQTTNISGIVNTYHNVVEIVPAKAAIRVSSTAGLSLSQTIMIIQMKGASVITTNGATFGNVTSLNNAGNYELGVICGLRGDSIFLFHTLANTYTITGKVQVIGMPTYYNAVVTDTLRAQTWNNATGTGGVIAINVEETLTLNKPVYADAAGFNGGDYVLSNGSCNNFAPANAYIYNASATGPQNGGYKGESIYDVTAGQSGGRGAVASGGGGGNNHNNGGGGGANLAAGGNGGGNSSSASGACKTDLKGLGGKALNTAGGTKIFPGGGGGAGHSNQNVTPTVGAGNGGGIIFIHANTLISNNEKISANGGVGGNAISDGASGGGGGGTIIADIENYSGTLTVRVSGGNGGTENDGGNIGYCYGAGGGGGGGAVYFKNGLPVATIQVNGGAAGAELGRDPGCNPIIAAVAGSAGGSFTNYSYTRSVVPGNYCAAIPLPLGLIYFKAILRNNKNVLLQWKIAETPGTKKYDIEKSINQRDWATVAVFTNASQKNLYEYVDANPFAGNNYYRLKITDANYKITYSALQKVYVQSPGEQLVVYPNPAKENIIIEGELPVATKIRLLSADGKLIIQKEIVTNQHRTQFNLPALTPGVYFIQVNNLMKKIVIRQ
jgi:hypothetical protein